MSTEQDRTVIKMASGAIRTLMEERDVLRAEISVYKSREKALDLADKMAKQGLIDPATPSTEKIAMVLNSGKDIDLLEEALTLSKTAGKMFSSKEAVDVDDSNNDFINAILGN